MLSSAHISASVGSSGWGACAMPPSLLAAVPGVQGTRLPVAGMAPRVRAGAVRRQAVVPGPVIDLDLQHFDRTTQKDGTTLGNHSSRRPLS